MEKVRNGTIVNQQQNRNDFIDFIFMILLTDIIVCNLIGNTSNISIDKFENILPSINESDIINKRTQLVIMYHKKTTC